MATNFSKLFKVQNDLEKVLKQVCPAINSKSGIYFLIRKDDEGKYAYIGKAVNLIRRMVSHLQGYKQPIDISLKKRGFKTPENELGWELNVLFFAESELDSKESYYINNYLNAGYELYNIESGGTIGKTIINERKSPKGYKDGVAYGEKKTRLKVKEYFDKYLDIVIKDKPNKIKEKKFEEFKDFIK